MTSDDMKASKSLEFPVVALPGVGHMPAKGEDEPEAARVFYVVATRRLVIGVGGDWGFCRSLSIAPASALGLSPARGKKE
jgi:superfamily I DNA/RNA helicase